MNAKTQEKYFEAVGRRKSSVARVRVWPAARSSFSINEKDIKDYFVVAEDRQKISEVLNQPEMGEKVKVSAIVSGGGIVSQADAIVLGLARALTVFKEDLRKPLKKKGFLSRDPRVKERRKFGLKKARKAPQWSKR